MRKLATLVGGLIASVVLTVAPASASSTINNVGNLRIVGYTLSLNTSITCDAGATYTETLTATQGSTTVTDTRTGTCTGKSQKVSLLAGGARDFTSGTAALTVTVSDSNGGSASYSDPTAHVS